MRSREQHPKPIAPVTLLRCGHLAEVEFDGAEVAEHSPHQQGPGVLAVCMRDQFARSNVVQVIGETLGACEVQVLVVVFGDASQWPRRPRR